MGRYYFDIEDGSSDPDREGTILADLDAARTEALRRSVRLLASREAEFWRGDNWKLIVSDERRLVLFTLNFMAVNASATRDYDRKPSDG